MMALMPPHSQIDEDTFDMSLDDLDESGYDFSDRYGKHTNECAKVRLLWVWCKVVLKIFISIFVSHNDNKLVGWYIEIIRPIQWPIF